jgi:hypothetical protein
MKNLILLTLITLTLFSCGVSKQTSSVKTSTETSVVQDGLTYETAIIIQQKDEMSGIGAEYAWLRQNYPGCRLKQQSLTSYNDKPYDIMTIFTSEGKVLDIYFDISNFFGKY